MAKGKTYELALKIAGRVDSSLKKACLDADENLGKLAKTAEKIGQSAVRRRSQLHSGTFLARSGSGDP